MPEQDKQSFQNGPALAVAKICAVQAFGRAVHPTGILRKKSAVCLEVGKVDNRLSSLKKSSDPVQNPAGLPTGRIKIMLPVPHQTFVYVSNSAKRDGAHREQVVVHGHLRGKRPKPIKQRSVDNHCATLNTGVKKKRIAQRTGMDLRRKPRLHFAVRV